MARISRSYGFAASTLAMLIALGILVSLGTWQLQRKAWKEHLLAQIAERTTAPPVPLAHVLSSMTATFPEGYDPEYMHVTARGTFLHDKEQYLWTPDPSGGPGYQVYTPLQLADGAVVWVNRGYVPLAQIDPQTRAPGQIAGDAAVTGLVRKPVAPGWFTPDNEAYRRIYYWRALDEMHHAAFGAAGPRMQPFSIDADAEPPNPGGLPRGGATLVALSNRHLEYALTWFGLAAALIAVYAAYVVGRGRRAESARDASENR